MSNPEPNFDRSGSAGSWAGYYALNSPSLKDRKFPISATIDRKGPRLLGTMIDGTIEWSRSLRHELELHDAGPNPQPATSLRQALVVYPDAVVETTFHPRSTLRGWAWGRTVAFSKTYDGVNSTVIRAGGQVLGRSDRSGSVVHYRGRLDWAGECIEGKWRIRFPGPLGRFVPPIAEGPFVLRRSVT